MKLNLWNVKILEPPPRNTYRAKNQAVDINALHEVLTEAFNTFSKQKRLHEEAAILSRCIYRMKLKFRSDKGLKAMEKMNRALLQFLRMNIPQLLETFCSMVPQKYTHNTYLPTLNMLHYVLVRIQGLSKLMIRVVDSAQDAAEWMERRIGLGHFWKVAFICLGVISRLFVLTKELARFCCKFYSHLLPFTQSLKNVGFNWLPADYCLPQDLKSWLNIDWLDKDEVIVKNTKKFVVPAIFNMVDSDSDEFCNEYTEIQDDVEITNEYIEVKKEENVMGETDIGILVQEAKSCNSPELKNNNLNRFEIEEDIGEVIQPCVHPQKNSKRKRKKVKTTTDLGNLMASIETVKDLKKFEKDFDNVKMMYPNIFKKLDRLQVNMLHRSIKKWTNKAKKQQADQSKVNFCISKAKEVLKSSLM